MKVLKKYSYIPNGPGMFGYVRKHDIHTGVDLYCEPGSIVYAIENGVVVAIEDFTGPEADSPWWNSTKAILIEGTSGVICYGEVEPSVECGSLVLAGESIATVQTVLKKNKGWPMTMLHMELYKPRTTKTVWWKLNEKQPEELLDVTVLLKKKGIL
jgi:hypothetical protein